MIIMSSEPAGTAGSGSKRASLAQILDQLDLISIELRNKEASIDYAYQKEPVVDLKGIIKAGEAEIEYVRKYLKVTDLWKRDLVPEDDASKYNNPSAPVKAAVALPVARRVPSRTASHFQSARKALSDSMGSIADDSSTFNLVRTVVTNDRGTEGIFYYGKTRLAYTIELPWRNNQRMISCIPDGVYPITFVPKGSIPQFPYDHIDVHEVPNRDGIKIHIAYKPSDLLGCIGVGLSSQDMFVGFSDIAIKDVTAVMAKTSQIKYLTVSSLMDDCRVSS